MCNFVEMKEENFDSSEGAIRVNESACPFVVFPKNWKEFLKKSR